MIKVAVVGNQEGWTYDFVKAKLEELEIDHTYTIISGGARGVDTFAEEYAREKGCTIIIHYPVPSVPSPQRYFERNQQIAAECDWMVAFDAKSGAAGTKNTVAQARRLNKAVFLFTNPEQVVSA